MFRLATVSCKISEQHNDHVPMTDQQIYIVGPRRIKNELLTYFLERETGAQCQSKEKIRQVPGLDDKNIRLRTQVLWDCLGKDLETLMANIASDANNVLTENLVSLFDVDPVLGIEEKSLALGVRGFFYEGDSLELLLKGVHAIFEGEWWVSRRIMAKCIVNRHREGSLGANGFLTRREIEVLTRIAAWDTNDEIADKLCISRHTVKTHVHHIFKKIDVPSRFQAARWATKNL